MYKIVLVEDEKNIRKGLEKLFDWENANSELLAVAKDGEEGLKKIYALKPDIVITDVRMPKMDGLKMLEKASKIHDFKSIIISGYDDFEYARKALTLRVNEYILKPIDFDELSEAILNVQDKEKIEIDDSYGEVKAIIDYIKLNINKRIYLEDLCNHFNLSSTTLNEITKRECEMTTSELVNQIKINYASSLLKLKEYKMYEISDMTGFSSYKHFSYVFKKIKGVSPSAYKSKLNNKE